MPIFIDADDYIINLSEVEFVKNMPNDHCQVFLKTGKSLHVPFSYKQFTALLTNAYSLLNRRI